MPKQTVTIENARLKDESGRVCGKIVKATLEIDLDNPASWGGVPGGASSTSPNDLHGRQEALEVDAGTATASGRAREYDPVPDVWAHYCAVMKPRNTGLDAQARAVIRDALKVATVDECRRAIDGCAASDFHMGKNDRRKKYNRLTHILKGKRGTRTTREQIDLFLDILADSGRESGLPSGMDERVRQAKRVLMDAAEFPADDILQARASEEREWLVALGWQIEYELGGIPILIEPIS